MLVVNLFAGPGAGKSTLAAALFSELKRRHVNVELATEFSKDLYWDGTLMQMSQFPIYFFANQHHRVARLDGKVDVVVTDSPFLLGLIYQAQTPELKALCLAEHRRWPSLNVMLVRRPDHPYQMVGRDQTAVEAASVDMQILHMLNENNLDFTLADTSDHLVSYLVDSVVSYLKRQEWAA